MTGNHTRRTGAALRTLQMAAFPCPAKPSRRSGDSPLAPRAATKLTRSLNDQFQVCSQEASTMATICKRPHTDDGAAVMGRAAAKHPHVHRGPGGNQAPNALGVTGCPIRVLRRPGGQS